MNAAGETLVSATRHPPTTASTARRTPALGVGVVVVGGGRGGEGRALMGSGS